MKAIITHKVVKSEGIDHGMNWTPISNNLFMKAGTEKEIRKYFDGELYLRANNHAIEDSIRGCKSITKSKNQIRFHTVRDTVVLFEIKRLSSKEYNKYNNL